MTYGEKSARPSTASATSRRRSEVGLTGEVEYRELREHAKKLERELERLPGVSSVDRRNYLDREVKIEVSPERMEEYQVSLRDIVNAIAARNVRMTGGTFESFTSERTVVTLAEFENPQEVRDVVVRSTFEGPMIRIRDLASVTDGFKEPTILSRMNGKPAISFLVNKKESADVIRTVDRIKALLEEVRPGLPEGVQVEYSADMSKYVSNRLQVVMNNGMIGLALVVLTLTLFLNMRSAFWTAMGIPVTALGVIFMLPKFDSFLDVISMAAMIQVIGIIVDDGIIIAENIHKYRERGYAPVDAAVEGLKEVFWPVTVTIVTTFVAFAPMFFMSGILGKFVFVIPLVISLALFISLFEAIVALPAHLIWGIRTHGTKAVKKKEVSWFDRIRNFYRWSMRYIITLRYVFIAASVAALVFAIKYAQENIDFVLFPSESADTFFMLAELPTGTSLQATTERMKEVEKFIEELPHGEVESYVMRVGMPTRSSAGYARAPIRSRICEWCTSSTVADRRWAGPSPCV
jgi:multidrug efflux pump subunit AcrB